MAIDDPSGGGGGVYTPQWKRDEDEKKWEEESIRRQVAERNEGGSDLSYDGGGSIKSGLSYSGNGDNKSYGGTVGNKGITMINEWIANGGKNDEGGGSGSDWLNDNSGGMINNDAENRDEDSGGSYSYGGEVSGVGSGGGVQAPAGPVPSEETKEESKRTGKEQAEEKPVVYTGGASNANGGTGAKGSGASGTKAALTENGLPEGYMDWTAEQWAEWQKNPENREAAVRAANAPLAAARGERTLQDREHILGAGPNEPGAPIWPVANPQGQLHYLGAGPNEPGTPAITVAPRNYMSDYQPNPALTEQLMANYLADNGLSWAGGGQPAGGGAVVNTTSVTDDYPGGAQAMLEDGIRIRMGQGMSYDQALQETRADIARQNLLAAAGDRLSYQPYQPPVTQGSGDQSRNGEPETTRDIYAETYQSVVANGGSDREAEIAAARAVEASDNSDPIGNWFRESQKDVDVYNAAYGETYADAISKGSNERDAETAAMKAAEQAANNNRVGTPGNQRYDARQGKSNGPAAGGQEGLSYNGGGTPLTEAQRQFEADEAAGKYTTEIPNHSYQIPGTETYAQAEKGRTAGANTNPARQGAEALMNTWDGNSNYRVGTPGNQRYDARLGQTSAAGGTGSGGKDQAAKAGTGGTNSKGTGTKGSGTNKDVPDGSKYYNPSYGQDGKVVKAPYRKGGYTEAEIKAMGNKARSDQKYYNGKKAYEGYYLAPDGNYYPVDQIKANYYRQNGSYKGWEEGMRDYWNAFGTFYGYRPDWKTAGRAGGGGGSRGGYSYGGGGRSYGSSQNYGAGSTANNGLYWNPNTSWSI